MDAADSSETRATSRARSPWRWPRRVAGTLVVLAIVAWVAVPIAVRRIGEAQATQALGRTLRIGGAHFNPLTLRLRLDDVALAGPRAGAPDAATLAHLELAIGWRSIWHRAPVLTEVLVDQPALRFARTGAGRFDFDDILVHLAQRPASPTSDPQPARFAVYNIRIEGGSVAFDDQLVHHAHKLESFRLGVPFVSNLPGDTGIEVVPRLQFVLDGASYDSNAQATPFRTERAGDIALHTGEIDLAPWLEYWPASLGWHPTRGRVKIDASLRFDAPAKGAPRVSLAGDLAVDDLALANAAGEPLVGWRRLAIGIGELRPLERKVALKRVALDGLEVTLARDAHGQLNVARAFAGDAPASAPAPASPASAPTPPDAPATPWSVKADAIDLDGARIAWRDARVAPAVAYRVDDLQLRLANVRWPLPPGPAASAVAANASTPAAPASAARPVADDAVRVHLQGRWVADGAAANPASAASAVSAANAANAASVAGAARKTLPRAVAAAAPASVPVAGSFTVDGRLGALRSHVDLVLDGVALGPLRPYLVPYWSPATDGDLGLRAQARWDGALQDVAPTVTVAQLAVDGLSLREAGRAVPAGAWRRAAIGGLVVDLPRHRAELASLELTQPEVWVERDAAGVTNVSRWVVSGQGGAPAPAASAASAPPSDWQAHVGRVAVTGGRVHWRDAPPGGPVALDVDGLQASLADAGWPARPHATSALKVAARLSTADRTTAAATATAGTLDFDGRLGLAPLAWQGRLRAERVPLHLADAYLADASPLQLLHADFGWRGGIQGAVSDQGLQLHVKGDAVLTDLHTRARHAADVAGAAPGADDLLNWQSLSATATEVTLAPGHTPVVVVGGVKLVNAYARLVVTEQGHFNLTDLAPPAAASAPAPAVAVAAVASAPVAIALAAALPASAASAVIAAAGTSDTPDIRIGGVAWTDARIEYTDRFVRPNYSADLTGVTGTLGAFSMRKPDLAALSLTGRVAGTGVLDIQGQLNPLAKPLALDVRAKASDIELAPLSPYAGKYAGYAIERGKLSMDVHYKIAPDGHLEAGNRVILNQLTFGEKVDSPTATKLPVLFAVALLKDRNGVIDVNLPVGGSINDPQFSVGGIVVKVILNLLEKAILSPFSLLSGSGESDLSQVLFVPGTARPKDGAGKTFDSVAKALQDRPALQLTITGLSDDAQEHADLQAANLEARLVGLRRTELLQAGDVTASPNAPAPSLTADERARLVKRLYADTKLPDKPRNVLGMAKDVPQAEMEQRLEAGLPLAPDAARQLAIARALVVRDALAERGLPNERMFVASPKSHGAGSAEPEEWLPHAQLQLTAK